MRYDALQPDRQRASDDRSEQGTRRLLLAIALASGITSVPSVAIVLAFPTITRRFNASETELEWTVTGYMLAYSALLIAAGRLADIFGRVRSLRLGTLVFVGASVAAAFAHNPMLLIAGMFGAGLGAAILTPASLAIVTESFRGERRAMAVGVWSAASAFFSGIAPAIGGVFTAQASWRWILWLNVIVGALVLAGVRRAAESSDEQATRHIDYTGLGLLIVGLSAIMLALNEAPAPWRFSSARFQLVLGGGMLLLVSFALFERRLRHPLIDIAMFVRRNLSGACIVGFVLSFTFGAAFFFLPIYLHELLGYGALESGLLLLPMSLATMIAMPLGGRLFQRFGPGPPIIGGLALSGGAMLLLGGVSSSTHYAGVWPALALLGLGVGVALTPMNLTALNSVPRRNHGAVSGIIATVGGLGATFGVALSGAVFEQLQTDRTVSAADGHGLHITDSAARTLEGLLAGTPAATKMLAAYPLSDRAALRADVRDGFISALGTTMQLSLVFLTVGILLTLLLIRRHGTLEPLERPNVAEPFSGLSPRP
jgi:EmrB/QacA subfamily drug resistance transporter